MLNDIFNVTGFIYTWVTIYGIATSWLIHELNRSQIEELKRQHLWKLFALSFLWPLIFPLAIYYKVRR